jgi:hypothetical protein
VTITGTFDYSPFIPLIIPTFNGGDIDFEQFAFDIVATTRVPVVQ